VGNALRSTPNVVVLSEVSALSTVASPGFFHGSFLPDRDWPLMRQRLLSGLVSIYGHHDVATDPHVVIKWIPFGLLQMALIRSVWPTVPVAVLIRDPVEVMVSNIERPPAFMLGWRLESNEALLPEYCARSLGLLYSAAFHQADDTCLVLDYEQLTTNAIATLAAFFGVLLRSDSDALRRISATYSKDPTRSRTFEGDGDVKRIQATEEIRDWAARLASPWYLALRHRAGLLTPSATTPSQ
jgi:hypothetical protein